MPRFIIGKCLHLVVIFVLYTYAWHRKAYRWRSRDRFGTFGVIFCILLKFSPGLTCVSNLVSFWACSGSQIEVWMYVWVSGCLCVCLRSYYHTSTAGRAKGRENLFVHTSTTYTVNFQFPKSKRFWNIQKKGCNNLTSPSLRLTFGT